MKSGLMGFCSAGVAFACTMCAFATSYTWTGGDGDWEDATKWKNETSGQTGDGYPCQSGDAATVNKGIGPVIRLDSDYTLTSFKTANETTFDESNTVTLTGSGSLTLGTRNGSTQSFTAGAERRLVLDGLRVFAWDVQYIMGNGELVLKNGAQLRSGEFYMIYSGCRLTVDGGEFLQQENGSGRIYQGMGWTADTGDNNYFITLKSGRIKTKMRLMTGTYSVSGGEFIMLSGNSYGFPNSSVVNFTGGLIRLPQTSGQTPYAVPASLFPPAGATLDLLRSEGLSAAEAFPGASDTFDLPGTLVLTNSQASFSATRDCSITGGGTLVTSAFSFRDPTDASVRLDADFWLGSLVLKDSLTVGTGSGCGLHFRSPITFGALGDWQVSNFSSPMSFDSFFSVYTSDWRDRVTPRTITLASVCLPHLGRVSVAGTGMADISISQLSSTNTLNRVDVRDTATLKLRGRAIGIRVRKLAFDPGTTLRLASDNLDSSNGSFYSLHGDFESYPGSLEVARPMATAEARQSGLIPLVVPDVPMGDVASSLLPIATIRDVSTWAETESSYSLVNLGGSLVLLKGSPTSGLSDNHWTGAAGGLLSTAGNWSDGSMPASGSGTVMRFDGVRNTVVTNDVADLNVKQMIFAQNSGPFVIRSETPICFCGTSGGYDTSQVRVKSRMPVVFDSEVAIDNPSDNTFVVYSDGCSYVAFLKDVTLGDKFRYTCDTRIGATLTCNNLYPDENWANRAVALTVMSGACVNAVRQTLLMPTPTSYIVVDEGGVVRIDRTDPQGSSAGKFGWKGGPMLRPNVVDGLFDIRVPLYSESDMKFEGSGRLNIADAGTLASASYRIWLGGSLKAYVNAWGQGRPAYIYGSPTLGATTDWTYGANVGAIELRDSDTVLTVNTLDPDTSAAHNVAIDASIVGPGMLVKEGAGSLTLGSTASSIGVVVKGGSLSWTAPQNFESLSFLPGASLLVKGASVPALTVKGDLDLSAAKLEFSPESHAALNLRWTTILSVSAGSSIVGLPAVDATKCSLRTRIVDGHVVLQAREARRFIMILR